MKSQKIIKERLTVESNYLQKPKKIEHFKRQVLLNFQKIIPVQYKSFLAGTTNKHLAYTLKLSFPTLLQNTKLFTHDRASESFLTQQSQQPPPIETQPEMYLSSCLRSLKIMESFPIYNPLY